MAYELAARGYEKVENQFEPGQGAAQTNKIINVNYSSVKRIQYAYRSFDKLIWIKGR